MQHWNGFGMQCSVLTTRANQAQAFGMHKEYASKKNETKVFPSLQIRDPSFFFFLNNNKKERKHEPNQRMWK